MKTPKIKTVNPMKNKQLLVKFENGVTRVYDCKPLLVKEMFRLLENEAFFKSVKVDSGGYGISWNDDIDLSEYEIWVNGKEYPLAA
ncbi:MAG: DUF2442 domain-containing protein [Desulfatiglans sp.]|jgi:hypothetical protein|nr:DUF2442 domain-containing protein [Desulfatiglans sp.]